MPNTQTKSSRAAVINDFLASLNILTSVLAEKLRDTFKDDLGNKLTMSQYQMLKLVANTHAGRISDVARFLDVTNAAASKAVERLVRRGLITREQSPGDRRANVLALTANGESVLACHEEAHARMLDELIPALPLDELKEASLLLDKLSVGVHKYNSTSDELCFRCGIYFRDKCLLRELSGRNCYYHLRRKADT